MERAITYALLEGLAGVEDQGTAFSRTRIAPRWEAADVRSAEVTVKYPSSNGYCRYRYSRTGLSIELCSSLRGPARNLSYAFCSLKTGA